MHLIEILLPLTRGDGTAVSSRDLEDIVEHLVERFGGATAFLRSPAKGVWKGKDDVTEDRIVVIEVMVDNIDTDWWGSYRSSLAADLIQQEILIRATECRTL